MLIVLLKGLKMSYNKLLKEFTILIETIPKEIDFYDIWEIRPLIEELDKNFKYLSKKEKDIFSTLFDKLIRVLEKTNIKKDDSLAKEEVNLLLKIAKKEKDIFKAAA